jgi:hypothetical protein
MAATCNREHMTALAEALESGDYPQAQFYLRVTDTDGNVRGYCCAGVAGVLAAADGVGAYDEHGVFRDADSDPGEPYDNPYGDAVNTPASKLVMTTGICEWLGLVPGELATLDTSDVRNLPVLVPGLVPGTTGVELATNLNDHGEDFTNIAARLRETYLAEG